MTLTKDDYQEIISRLKECESNLEYLSSIAHSSKVDDALNHLDVSITFMIQARDQVNP